MLLKGEEMRARRMRSSGSIRRNCHARVAMNTDVLFAESCILPRKLHPKSVGESFPLKVEMMFKLY